MPILIYITCADKDEARRLSKVLLEEKLIACVNIFPMESMYWWQGDIVESMEYVVIAKGMPADFEALIMRVKDLHSYEVPCIVSVPITGGNSDYLEWIKESTKK